MFDDLQHFFISLSRGLNYFNDVELRYPYYEFQTNWIFYRDHTKQKKHKFYCVADTIKVMFSFFRSSIKDPICLKLVRCFCCYSASTKTSFCFCSCSELLQLKFGKKNRREMLIAPASGVTKVANERYLPYLQLLRKVVL